MWSLVDDPQARIRSEPPKGQGEEEADGSSACNEHVWFLRSLRSLHRRLLLALAVGSRAFNAERRNSRRRARLLPLVWVPFSCSCHYAMLCNLNTMQCYAT
jgi:hypothetical protein